MVMLLTMQLLTNPLVPVNNIFDDEHLHQEPSYATLIDSSTVQPLQRSPGVSTPTTAILSSERDIESPRDGLGDPVPSPLPSFIKPLPMVVDADNLAFLQKKGAFQIPPLDLRNEVLSCYLKFIHPALPLLNASILRQILETKRTRSQLKRAYFCFRLLCSQQST